LRGYLNNSKEFAAKEPVENVTRALLKLKVSFSLTHCEMSEIAKGTISRASAQSKPAISEHAQKHAPCFSSGSVFDN